LYIRFAHEMNLQSSPWGPGRHGNTPERFVKAWRHVVAVFDDAGADNVEWVWAPNVDCEGKCPFEAFYPGDRNVDWLGLDGYNFGPSLGHPWRSFASIFKTSYQKIVNLSRRPVMIAETASAERGGDKAAWIRQGLLSDVPALMPRVRMIIWFDVEQETDWRIDSSAESLESFRQVVGSRLYTNRLT
jgi:beta-mannanase